MRFETKSALVPLFFAALGAIVFWPDVAAEFLLWDDKLHLTTNPFSQLWTKSYQALYSPVLYTIWLWVTTAVGWLWPDWRTEHVTAPFLLLNGLFHLGNTLLAYALLKSAFQLSRRASIVAALVFFVHPMQVESVVWISGFKELLWSAWALFALWAFARDRIKLSVFFASLAILSKPTAVMMPLLLVALGLHSKKRVPAVVMAILALVVSVVTKVLQPNQIINSPVGIPSRVLTAWDALGFYVTKIIWPFHLHADYGRRPDVVLANGFNAYMIIGIAVTVGALWWFGFGRKRWPNSGVTIGLALFVIPLLPVLGFVPFAFQNYSTVADRYAYMPILGFGVLLAMLVDLRPRFLVWPLGGLLLTYSLLFRAQAAHWRTNERFFSYTFSENPVSYMAANNLGVLAEGRGERDLALSYFEKSFALNPSYAEAAKNLGAMLLNTGQFSRAAEHFARLVEREPKWVEFRSGYGAALVGLGRFKDAIGELEVALSFDPQDAFATEQLAIALSESGRHSEALPLFERAVELDPNEPSYKLNLQRARDRSGHKN